MAYTLEQLQTLEDAIAQGARDVMYGDKRVSYRTLDEMIKIRDMMRVELGIKPKTPKNINLIHQKGL